MRAARNTLLALCGFLLVTPCAQADSRRSGGRVIITYTYRTYGS